MNGAAAPALGPCPFCGQPHPEDVFVCPEAGKTLPLEGRLLDGKFRFTRLLGAGGMGAVWKAHNIRVKKAVAIKLMHPEFAGNPGILERFRNEATAAGEIGSQHICDIYDFGTNPVLGPYIVLEMLNGSSLGELIQKNGRIEPGLAVLILRQALEGLEAAHRAGIVHRDLKPENIFLHEPTPGRLLVKLMDFGISKFSQGGSEGGRTSAGVLMGTPEYMSPEQTEGAAGVDQRTDIWAMGAILYKALTGADAFSGASMAAILVAVSTKPHAPVSLLAPHVPPGLIAVIDRCLAKNPGDRFNSAAELASALAPFEQLGAPLPPMPTTHTQAPMTASPPAHGTMGAGSPPPQPHHQATLITGGPPPTNSGQQFGFGGPPPTGFPQGTFTGGPPPASQNKATWTGEIARPAGADDSWSIGAGAPETRPPSTLSGASSGSNKGVVFAVLGLVLLGLGGGVFFLTKKPPRTPEEPTAGATGASAGEVAASGGTPTPDTKVETPPPDTKVETPPPDTKVETPPDTKTGDTKVETPPPDKKGDEDKKGDDDKKPQTKPKTLTFEYDVQGTRLAGRMLFEKAKEYCAGLDLGGSKSWRLPKSGELLKAKGGAKLAGRTYWTSDESAGRVKVVDMTKGVAEEVAANAIGINVVCVTLK